MWLLLVLLLADCSNFSLREISQENKSCYALGMLSFVLVFVKNPQKAGKLVLFKPYNFLPIKAHSLGFTFRKSQKIKYFFFSNNVS